MLLEEWPSLVREGFPSGPMWVTPLSMLYILTYVPLVHKLALKFEMTSVSPSFLSDLRKTCTPLD